MVSFSDFLVGSASFLLVFLIFGFSLFFESAIHVDLPAWTGWFSCFFSDNGRVLFLFSYLLGTLFGSAFLLELPARAARGIVFSRFPRLGMLSGVTLVN